MPARAEPINAIAYAQFHLRGGFKGLSTLAGLTLLAVSAVGVLMWASNRNQLVQAAHGEMYVLVGVQWLVLSVFGFQRVAMAVRQDVTSGLLESHRLTPTSPLAAVAGYVVGAPVQVLTISGMIFLAGGVLCLLGDVPPIVWISSNVMALSTAGMLWALSALVSFGRSTGGAVPGLVAMVGVGASFVPMVPAAAVLGSPLIGRSIWTGPLSGSLPPAYAFALLGDVLLGSVFYLAASRRYRGVATEPFNIPLGLLLLLVWSALTAAGLAYPELFSTRRTGDSDDRVRVIAGAISSVLVAFVPVVAIARYSVRPAEMYAPKRPPRWPWAAWLLIPVCVALVCVGPLSRPDLGTASTAFEREAGTATIVATLLVAIALLAAWQDLLGRGAKAAIVLWLMITHLIPIALQAALSPDHTLDQTGRGCAMSYAPLVALGLLGGDRPNDVWPGILGQVATLTIPLALLLNRQRTARGRGVVADSR